MRFRYSKYQKAVVLKVCLSLIWKWKPWAIIRCDRYTGWEACLRERRISGINLTSNLEADRCGEGWKGISSILKGTGEFFFSLIVVLSSGRRLWSRTVFGPRGKRVCPTRNPHSFLIPFLVCPIWKDSIFSEASRIQKSHKTPFKWPWNWHQSKKVNWCPLRSAHVACCSSPFSQDL